MNLMLTITGIAAQTERIRVFDLAAPDGGALPTYTPGAHLEFDLGDLGTRAYSLIDWPGEADPGRYRIAVQREPDGQGGSRRMHEFASGETLRATPPRNDFELGEHDGPAVLLAGGIGITPLISMATALQTAGRPFAFHHAARSAGVAAFTAELAAAFGDTMRFHYDDQSPIDLAALMQDMDPAAHLYVCGPRGMIDAAREAAQAADLPDAQVHVELFSTPEAQAGDAPFEVELASSGEVFSIPPGKSIIEVLEAEGHDLIYDCQRGDCGICQTDVIAGIPDHRDVVLSEAERASGKVMQICVSRAASPRLVLDL